MINPTNSPYTGAESFTPSIPGHPPLAGPYGLANGSDRSRPMGMDITDLSPAAQREILASTWGLSEMFRAGISRGMESEDPRSEASIAVEEGRDIAQILNNMSVGERLGVFRNLSMNIQETAPDNPYPTEPPLYGTRVVKGALVDVRKFIRAKELLDGTGQKRRG